MTENANETIEIQSEDVEALKQKIIHLQDVLKRKDEWNTKLAYENNQLQCRLVTSSNSALQRDKEFNAFREECESLRAKLKKKKLKIAKLQKKLCEMILKEAEHGEGEEEI